MSHCFYIMCKTISSNKILIWRIIMSLEYSTGFCKVCNEQKKLERKMPNHILHLLITVVLGFFSFGILSILWIIVWIVLSIKIGGWNCSSCGSKEVNKKIEYRKLLIYSLSAIIIVVFLQVFKNKKIEESSDSDISTKYEIISDDLNKIDCFNNSVDYLLNKQKESVNIEVLNQNAIKQENNRFMVNTSYKINNIEKSLTIICTGNKKNIKIEEIEDK